MEGDSVLLTGRRLEWIGFALGFLACGPGVGRPARAESNVDDAPKCNVVLYGSYDAVQPGKAFDLGLQFQLAPGWHIYWKNSGDSGQPPRVTWKAPEGFGFGDLRYPIPKRHVAGGNIVTNIHEGEPVLLAEVTPPAELSGDTATIAADVRYLICNETCLIESAQVHVDLRVASEGAPPKPANESLFARARRALPSTSSKFIAVQPQIRPTPLPAGGEFEFLVGIEIQRGYHIQSNEPLNLAFIASEVFLERRPGVSFEEPVFPPPKFRTLKVVGKVSEFEGKVPVRIAGKLEPSVSDGPLQLAGIVKYQACDQKGTCFPPDAVAFSYTTQVSVASAGENTAPPAGSERAEPESEKAVTTTGDAPTEASDDSEVADAAGELEAFLQRFGLVGILLGCFLYGLAINATPCVLPLLSIKVLGFVQQAHESRRRTFSLALAFGAGVIIFFVILGFLASRGQNLLGNPIAVIVLGAVVMALALSMLGVYTLQPPAAATRLDANLQKEGLASSFGKGALAPVLGLACTAPFMAGMFALAARQDPIIAFLAFAVTGLGMASPYILLGAFPNWLGFLPKPGNWMITFERIMGFVLLGMTVLLLHPLTALIGVTGLEWTLVFLVVVAMACWLWGRINYSMSGEQRLTYRLGAVSLIVAGIMAIYGWAYPIGEARSRILAAVATGEGAIAAAESPIAWRPWSEQAVREAVASGKAVFVDFTSAYCPKCHVNKAVAINQPEVVKRFEEVGIIAFQADFTNNDDYIFEGLKRFGQLGPPLNLIYFPCRPDEPVRLPLSLTKELLLRELDRVASNSVTAC